MWEQFHCIKKLYQKYRCASQHRCVAYTYEQSRFNCILHSSIDKGRVLAIFDQNYFYQLKLNTDLVLYVICLAQFGP